MPYVLRCESHILTTEGVAMMFERFADDAGVAASDGREACRCGRRFAALPPSGGGTNC